MAVNKVTVMSLMRKALKAGQSRTSFFRDMKAEGLQYPRKVKTRRSIDRTQCQHRN